MERKGDLQRPVGGGGREEAGATRRDKKGGPTDVKLHRSRVQAPGERVTGPVEGTRQVPRVRGLGPRNDRRKASVDGRRYSLGTTEEGRPGPR